MAQALERDALLVHNREERVVGGELQKKRDALWLFKTCLFNCSRNIVSFSG
jgi:hypothetical protein